MEKLKMKKILLVEKLTDLEYFQSKEKPLKFKRRHEEKVIKILTDHKLHNDYTSTLVGILDKSDADYDRCKANHLEDYDYSDYGIILTSGGDGTVLAAAERIDGQLLVGTNSTYSQTNETSAGGLTIIDSRNLFQLRRLFNNDYQVERWRRLTAAINDKTLDDLAVNDIYVGHQKGYKSSYLDIEISIDDSESFTSSGIILTTGMGSHAWFSSAGGTQFGNELDLFGMIVREPFEKREKYQFTSRILSADQKITIYPERDNYVVVFDSKDNEYPVSTEDYVTVGLSDKSIRVPIFD